MLFEIHSYHYDPSKFDAYKQWAREEAAPFLKANLDIVGIWFDIGKTPKYWGADPTPSQHGAANATWIIRWESLEQRNRAIIRHDHDLVAGDAHDLAIYESEGWREVWAKHPDQNGYLHCEITFAEEL
jgi:hypothetical protein